MIRAKSCLMYYYFSTVISSMFNLYKLYRYIYDAQRVLVLKYVYDYSKIPL